MADYTSSSQQRILQVLQALNGRDLDGVSVTELAESVGTSKTNIVRDLANLELSGFAKRLEMNNERWRHGDAVTEMYAGFASNLLLTMRRVMNEAVSAATRSGTMID